MKLEQNQIKSFVEANLTEISDSADQIEDTACSIEHNANEIVDWANEIQDYVRDVNNAYSEALETIQELENTKSEKDFKIQALEDYQVGTILGQINNFSEVASERAVETLITNIESWICHYRENQKATLEAELEEETE